MFLTGLWGALVPFLGPTFGYSATGSGSWHWSLAHAWLWVVPGVVACVAGLIVMTLSLTLRHGRGKAMTKFAGVVSVVCGAWFVLGPWSWTVIRTTTSPFVSASPVHELENRVGYSLGPGLLLVLFGGLAIGLATTGKTPVATTRDERRLEPVEHAHAA